MITSDIAIETPNPAPYIHQIQPANLPPTPLTFFKHTMPPTVQALPSASGFWNGRATCCSRFGHRTRGTRRDPPWTRLTDPSRTRGARDRGRRGGPPLIHFFVLASVGRGRGTSGRSGTFGGTEVKNGTFGGTRRSLEDDKLNSSNFSSFCFFFFLLILLPSSSSSSFFFFLLLLLLLLLLPEG